jgi:hypothetical protein
MLSSRTLLSYLLVLLCLFARAGGVRGASVLCVGSDGQVSLEHSADGAGCDDCDTEAHRNDTSDPALHPDPYDCTDIAVSRAVHEFRIGIPMDLGEGRQRVEIAYHLIPSPALSLLEPQGRSLNPHRTRNLILRI